MAIVQSPQAICQVIMATHAPMLMAYPNARLLHLSKYGLESVSVEDTDHYRRQYKGRKLGGSTGEVCHAKALQIAKEEYKKKVRQIDAEIESGR